MTDSLNLIKTKLDYESVDCPGIFKISPSGISKFFDRKHEWYTNEVLKEKEFLGNTSTVLGTIVHYCAEEFTKNKKVDKEEIPKYLDKMSATLSPDVFDRKFIEEQWTVMGQTVIDYLKKQGLPQHSEIPLKYELFDGFWVGGTADAIHGDCLVDYKTTSDLTPKEYIPMHYKYQLLTYAFMANKLGIQVNRIRIVWITNNIVGRISDKTGKPMKDYPSQAVAITESITQEDLDFIESVLLLISETVACAMANPELTYLLFSDYRLKGGK